MTYVDNKPDPGPSPALDVATIQGNFAQFQTAFNANHTNLNKSKQGDHETVIFENQSVVPGSPANFAVLFSMNATSNAGTQPQLFVQVPKFLPHPFNPVDATNSPMQLTYNTVNAAGPVYQSFLPGGYILYFGTVAIPNHNIPTKVTLSPAPTKILIAMATPTVITGSIQVGTAILTNSTFNILYVTSNASNGDTYNWLAIGSV